MRKGVYPCAGVYRGVLRKASVMVVKGGDLNGRPLSIAGKRGLLA